MTYRHIKDDCKYLKRIENTTLQKLEKLEKKEPEKEKRKKFEKERKQEKEMLERGQRRKSFSFINFFIAKNKINSSRDLPHTLNCDDNVY